MKILYVATIAATMDFFPRHIEMLKSMGHEVEMACNCSDSEIPTTFIKMGIHFHNIPFTRSPLSINNYKAYKQLKEVVRKGNYDIIHTHTPNASAIVRIACKEFRKNGLKIIYTAHGFHFYKGAPLKNWLIFYPTELICSRWTDILITINKEDYELAIKKMRAGQVKYVPGVGIDIENFTNPKCTKEEKKLELGLPINSYVLFSVGELNENKNHKTIIRAIKGLDVYYIIAGVGDKKNELESVAKEVNMYDRVRFLGYRRDVNELLKASDAFVFPSFREGLSVALMEAVASGLPCIVSRIRGNVDLVDPDGGVLFNPNSIDDAKYAINTVISSNKNYSIHNKKKIQDFSTIKVIAMMKDIYNNI